MFWPSTQPSCLIDSHNGFVATDFASSCGLGAGPMPRIPTCGIFSDFCASPPSGARARLTVRATASPITRMGHLGRSEEHTSELQSRSELVCRLLLEKKDLPSAP